MTNEQRIPKSLSSRAKSLAALGLDEAAWTRSDALELLSHLKGAQVAVLGGDVYTEGPGQLEPTYDNWYCERRPGEEFPAYAERSQREAFSFVDGYPDLPGILFAFVLNPNETACL